MVLLFRSSWTCSCDAYQRSLSVYDSKSCWPWTTPDHDECHQHLLRQHRECSWSSIWCQVWYVGIFCSLNNKSQCRKLLLLPWKFLEKWILQNCSFPYWCFCFCCCQVTCVVLSLQLIISGTELASRWHILLHIPTLFQLWRIIFVLRCST